MRPAWARSLAGIAVIAMALIAGPGVGQEGEAIDPAEPTAPFAEDAEGGPAESTAPLEEDAVAEPLGATPPLEGNAEAEPLRATPPEGNAEAEPLEPAESLTEGDMREQPVEPTDSFAEEDVQHEPAESFAEEGMQDEPAEAIAPGPANANPLSTLDLESLTATRELPLFTPSRTPPVVEAPPEPEPEPEPIPEPEVVEETDPEPPPAELIGIVVTEAEQVVLLMDRSTGEVQRIRPGEDFEGWTISIIDSRTVELESEGNFQTLTMFTETGDPAQAFDEESWDDGTEFEEFDAGGSGINEDNAEDEGLEAESLDDEGFAEEALEDEGFEDESLNEEGL